MNEARRKLIAKIFELEQHAAYIANTLFAEAGLEDHHHAAEMAAVAAQVGRIRSEMHEECAAQQQRPPTDITGHIIENETKA